MPTLGEELRRRREERGTTLTDISEATRIGTRFLKAIETDNFSVLPGGIFTRSFIRAYAKQVGMDEDEAIALYQHQITGQTSEPLSQAQPQGYIQPPSIPQPQVIPEQHTRRHESVTMRQTPTRMSWPTIIIAAGILVFIVIIVFALVKRLNRSERATAEQQANRPAASEPAEQPQPSPQPAEQEASPPAPDSSEAQVPVAAQGEQIRVKLEATAGDSSIRYWVDTAEKGTSVLLKPGAAHDIPAGQNQVKILIGNRVGLKMSINDREATFPPETKKFAALVVITRENLQAFFQ